MVAPRAADRRAAVRDARAGVRPRHGGRPDSPPAGCSRNYAAFFAFGVFFRQRKIAVRRWWAVAIVPSLLLLLPAGVALLYDEGFQYAGAPWVWAGGRGGAGRLRVADVLRIDGAVPLDLRAGNASGCATCRMPPTGST